jgi:hypothetical protein
LFVAHICSRSALDGGIQISESNAPRRAASNDAAGLATDKPWGNVDDRFNRYHESARLPALVRQSPTTQGEKIMTDLKVIDGEDDGPPATVEQVVAIEFDGINAVREMSNEQRSARVLAIVNQVYLVADTAAMIIALDKNDLVKTVRKEYELIGPSLMEFSDAGRYVEMLREFIKSAEARLTVALACNR